MSGGLTAFAIARLRTCQVLPCQLHIRGLRSKVDHVHCAEILLVAQGLGSLDPEENLEIGPEFVGATRHPQGPYEPLRGPENGHS